MLSVTHASLQAENLYQNGLNVHTVAIGVTKVQAKSISDTAEQCQDQSYLVPKVKKGRTALDGRGPG